MKNSKKFLVLIPALGLFLSGCSFQEVKHSIGESWVGQHILHPIYDPIKNLINGGKKEEQKSGEKEEQKQEEETKEVNANWPTQDIATFWASYEVTDTVPGYTGESDAIEFVVDQTQGYVYVSIAVPSDSTEETVLATYINDIKTAGYTEYEEYEGYMSYASPNAQILLLPYDGTSIEEPGYIYISFGMVPEKGKESDTFPLSSVQEVLEYTESFPIPEGTSFEFLVDSQYYYSVYVTVHGGDLSAYLDALEAAGFDVIDYTEYGYAAAEKGDGFCLEIDAESNSEYEINYFIEGDDDSSD